MGGGEVARYLSRHRDADVTQAVLIASVVPYMLQTADNPDGVEQATFDGWRQASATIARRSGPTFFKDFYGVGLASHPVSDEVLDWSCAMSRCRPA